MCTPLFPPCGRPGSDGFLPEPGMRRADRRLQRLARSLLVCHDASFGVAGRLPCAGMTSITPVLTVRDAESALNFYERAFDAEEISRSVAPNGRLVVDLAIGEARFRTVDES